MTDRDQWIRDYEVKNAWRRDLPPVEPVTRRIVSDEAEFARRRNLPGVSTRMLDGGTRSWTVVLMQGGTEFGSKTDVTRRGKVVSTLYVLPPLPPEPRHCAVDTCELTPAFGCEYCPQHADLGDA